MSEPRLIFMSFEMLPEEWLKFAFMLRRDASDQQFADIAKHIDLRVEAELISTRAYEALQERNQRNFPNDDGQLPR